MKQEEFLNKKCKLVYLTGFVLDGIVTDVNKAGITFKTTQKTSFISWNVIRDLSIIDGDY
jgi:hypothetical protein